MERKVAVRAPMHELGLRRPIDMDLPDHGRERHEIVRALAPDPGKPVAAMHVTGGAGAERSPAIVEGDLRDRPEDVVAHRLERDDSREDYRHDARPHDLGDLTIGGSEAERAIGRRHQPPRKANALGLVGVQPPRAKAR
jgi:hypothetical protein